MHFKSNLKVIFVLQETQITMGKLVAFWMDFFVKRRRGNKSGICKNLAFS